MARYEPLPYVRPVRERNLRLSDLYLRQGEVEAEAARRSGDIQAQLWGNVGQVVGNATTQAVQGIQSERERVTRDADAAQVRASRELTLGQQRREVTDRENFDMAMGAGSRERTLSALKDRPELYQKAQAHFESIDTSRKKLMGDVAAGIADFGYTPDAAMAAIDDLIEQGFDERKMDQYRGLIQKNPDAVKQIVSSLLSQSPDPRHQAMAKPQPLVELNKDTSLYDPNNGKVVASGPQSPAPQRSLQAKEVLLDGRPVMATFDPAAGTFSVGGQDVTSRVRPVPPQGPAGGEPLESVIGPDGSPVLLPRSQARGMRPATTREQPTEDERKSAGFYTQMQEAMRTLDEVENELTEKDLYQIQTLPQEALMGMANRGQMSEAAKRYLRAFEQFTEARMRPVSGAAISDTEFARDRRTYAKQYAETPKLAEDRRAARTSALESLRARASRAMPKDDRPAAAPPNNPFRKPK